MARPRSFDLDDALASTMACFRQNGFDATSMRDLEAATGLKAASLYAAVGNKAALYRASLDRYRDRVVRRRIREHLTPEAGLGGIRSFFSSTYASEPSPELGCMVASGATESDRLDQGARDLISSSLAEMRAAFRDVLAHCADDLDPSIDIDTAADLLLVLYQGQLGLMRGPDGSDQLDFDAVVTSTIQRFAYTPTTKERHT